MIQDDDDDDDEMALRFASVCVSLSLKWAAVSDAASSTLYVYCIVQAEHSFN